MQTNLVSRTSLAAGSAMVVGCMLAAAVPATAQPFGKPCSNNTLRGDYAGTVEGVVLPAPGVSFPIRGVVMAHYDGAGNFTQVDHIVFNGIPPATEWTPGGGTYQINADCTGTAHIDTSTGGFVNLALVVTHDGKELRVVVTAPFDGPPRTVTAVALRAQ
jgi:hypothetical protein